MSNTAELDVADDDKAAGQSDEDEGNEEDLEALKEKFLKKGRGKPKASGKANASKNGKEVKE